MSDTKVKEVRMRVTMSNGVTLESINTGDQLIFLQESTLGALIDEAEEILRAKERPYLKVVK